MIPYIEANYNVSHNADGRAFGGLSAGGARANQLMFNDDDDVRLLSAMWSVCTSGAPAAANRCTPTPASKSLLGAEVVGGGRTDHGSFATAGGGRA